MGIFPNKKNNLDWKIWEEKLLARLKPGEEAIPPLVVRSVRVDELDKNVDARVILGLKGETSDYSFVVEAKSRSTPLVIRSAMAQAKAAAQKGENPLIVVPYLSDERLLELEQEKVSGIDLCGNGLVIVPRRLYVRRSGQPNCYPDSRPLSKPFAGRSALVARVLLMRSEWPSLNEVASALKREGAELSLAQVSKAVKAMVEEVAILKERGKILVFDKQVLIDRLAFGWKKPRFRRQQAFRLEADKNWPDRLAEAQGLRWAVGCQAKSNSR